MIRFGVSMKDVSELGRIVKNLYPGEYDDIPDDELGRIYKQQHPGQYDDFVEVVPMVYSESPNLSTDHLDFLLQELDKLATKYNADRGVIASWFRRKQSEGRGQFLTALNEEMHQIIQAITNRAEAHSLEWRHGAALELELLLHRNQKAIIEIATTLGIDPSVYQTRMMMQIEVAKEVLIEKGKSQIRLDEERQRAQIDVEKAHALRESEADVTARMILLDKILDAHNNLYALIAAKAPKREIEASRKQLKELEDNRDNWGSIMKRKKRDD